MGLTKTWLFLVFCCQRYILLLGYCSMDVEAQQISLLDGEEDRFEGIVVNLMEVESMTVADFDAKLDASLKAWKDQGKKGIWIKLPRELSFLVDTAIKKGFTYHHAENEYAMLTSWLGEPPSTLPANASHRIGIGAFVLNKNGEENSGHFKDKNVWKVPTGTIKEVLLSRNISNGHQKVFISSITFVDHVCSHLYSHKFRRDQRDKTNQTLYD